MAQANPSRRKPTKRTSRRSSSADIRHAADSSREHRPGTARPTSRSAEVSHTRTVSSRRERTRPGEARTSGTRRQGARSQGTRTRSASSSTQRRKSANRNSTRRGVRQASRPSLRSGRLGTPQPFGDVNKQISMVITTVLVVAAVVLGGILFWTHRSVKITVNDEAAKIRVNSSLQNVHDKLKIVTKPGDYISVSGEVIERDEGYSFTARVDGKDLTRKEIESYQVHGGEQIEILDGDDRMEDYDVRYQEVQPKLVFDGSYGSVAFVKQWGKVGKLEMRTGKVSGTTAEGDWIDELQDCIIRIKNIKPEGDQKLVALTFDDGPASTYTQRALDTLAQYQAKATFFNLSENQSELTELAAQVAASGNQLCSHTNQHLDLATLGQEDLLYQITSAHDTIQQISGVDTTIIRPPYGSFTQNTWLLSQGTVSASILWTQDSLDWSLPGTDAIVQNALAGVSSGSIILMHDGGGPRDQSMDALPQVIKALQDEGYTLVTVSELLASDPEVPEEIVAGNATMPAGAVWPVEIGELPISV